MIFFSFTTVVFYPERSNILKLKTSSLIDTFYITNFHFHWGANEFYGSEHFINGKQYPLEVCKKFRS
jgi:hypothetical protein